jgi:GST-like protein
MSETPSAAGAENPSRQANPGVVPWRLFAARGWGSAIAEGALTLAGIAYERELIDPSKPEDRERLLALNPLGQLPTLVVPCGQVLTESAAIVLAAADLAPGCGLVPAGVAERQVFFRWLAFLVAAVYPTFTYGDEPARWVTTAPDELRRSTDEHRKALWGQLERAVVGPWFLGEQSSAIDLYVGIMTRWRPGRAWFAEHCPRLTAIAKAMDQRPELAAVWAANF